LLDSPQVRSRSYIYKEYSHVQFAKRQNLTKDGYPLKIKDCFDRVNICSIQHPQIWEMHKKKAIPCTWFVEEIQGLTQDVSDWGKKLTDGERHFLEQVLPFFAGADKIVADVSINFIEEIPVAEVQALYSHQAFMETIHTEMYGLLIKTYIRGPPREG